MGELLGGGALVAIATGALTFATQWGGALRAMEDHVDPDKHAAIVLAGQIETERKITAIEVNVDTIKTDVEDAKEHRESQAKEVQDVKTNQMLILERLQRVLEETERARLAAERSNGPDGGTP